MNAMGCQEELVLRVETISHTIPSGSILSDLTNDILEMVKSYEADGLMFSRTGDPVNALASFAYALGWLDAGCSTGLICTCPSSRGWTFSIPPLPIHFSAKRDEKAWRYGNLLEKGRVSVEIAPESETCLAEAAERVILAIEVLDSWGRMNLESGKMECALALFSYAFGWLDAGVRIGLFRVTRDREIFTL